MEKGAILLKDVQATKFDGGAKSVVKKIIGSATQSPTNVLGGELLFRHASSDYYNYASRQDSNVLMFCDINDIAPLNQEEFLLLDAIKKNCDRLTAFRTKLEWGVNLKTGSAVCVTVPGDNLSVDKRARATVHFKGLIGNLPGLFFGVEIMGTYRNSSMGTTDGTFQGKRYFTCQDECGLFLPLHLMHSTEEVPSQGKISPSECTESPKGDRSANLTYARATTKGNSSQRKESAVDPVPPIFKNGQRVAFYSIQGVKHYGVVGWTGRETKARKFPYVIVGITTDDQIFMNDFEKSVTGTAHLLPTAPRRRTLFIPEALVEAPDQGECSLNLSPEELAAQRKAFEKAEKSKTAKAPSHAPRSDNSLDLSPNELIAQRKAFEKAEKDKISTDDKASIDALVVADQSINITEQQEAYKKLQSKSRSNVEDNQSHQRSPATQRRGCEEVSDVQDNRMQQQVSKLAHDYEDIERHSPSLHHQQLHQGEQLPGADKNREVNQQQSEFRGVHRPLAQHARKPEQQGNESRNGSQTESAWNQQRQDQYGGEQYNNWSSDPSARPQQGVSYPSTMRADATSVGEGSINHNLGEGSLIQIPAPDPSHPMRYGTIKWTGLLPHAVGEVAGIELDEVMEGCTDGTFPGTGQKFFNCPPGKALYYPLSNVQADQRYAPEMSTVGNPLEHVSDEEETASATHSVDQYIGDEKGIQGHQNSCYLDATLFGLFALTNEFDAMFLQNSTEYQTIGYILWKHIVNPLRKNGVVKFECVMKLREQLDKLGKMKGITQDEKDPEEFLNMMFKHTLRVEPFINIRRPFGEEREYFVQLFLEMDDSQKLPTVGDLLDKMFSEQNISFTEVPKKLLIQVPRFGKKFQTFQKVIPAKSINVANNVDLRNPLKCYICEKDTSTMCRECMLDFPGIDNRSIPAFCATCLKTVHQHSHRQGHKHEYSDEMRDLRAIADFELLSVICIETSHYVCFTRQENKWIFFDSMASRVYDKYNIPKVVECTKLLDEWVYPEDRNMARLLDTPPRELPEYVRRFTQDIYMCVYIQPDLSMYG